MKSLSLLSKSVCFTKLGILILLTQFFRFNLKLKVSTASLLNSEVEKYLS